MVKEQVLERLGWDEEPTDIHDLIYNIPQNDKETIDAIGATLQILAENQEQYEKELSLQNKWFTEVSNLNIQLRAKVDELERELKYLDDEVAGQGELSQLAYDKVMECIS